MSQITDQKVAPSLLQFTETMKGTVTFSDLESGQAAKQNRTQKMPLLVHLTIEIQQVEHWTHHPPHQAPIVGYVECEALGGRRPIEHGTFTLFHAEVASANTRMEYRLLFQDASGRSLTLIGWKVLPGKTGVNIWQATTTLFVWVLAREKEHPIQEEQGQRIASGGLSLHVVDFLRQLASFRASDSLGKKRAGVLSTFFFFFVKGLWKAYYRAWKVSRHQGVSFETRSKA